MLFIYKIEVITISICMSTIFVVAFAMNIYYYRKSFRLIRDIVGDTEEESSHFRINLPQHAVVQLLVFAPSLIYALAVNGGRFFYDDYTLVPDLFSGLAGLGNVMVYFIQKRSAEKRDKIDEDEYYNPQEDDEYTRKDSAYSEAYMALHSDI